MIFNKKLITIFFLYLLLTYCFFNIEKYNNFSFKIFLKSFQEFEITENFPIHNNYFESINLLKKNKIHFFAFSEKVSSDEYLRFKIIVINYPKKYDINSKYLISFVDEVFDRNCITIEQGVFLKIIECQKVN